MKLSNELKKDMLKCMLRSEIGRVTGYNGYSVSYTNFRLALRNYFKRDKRYFNKGYKPAKNYGCYIFGQPNTWKGILSIDNPHDGEVRVIIDMVRDTYNAEDDFKNILKNLFAEMKKDGVIEDYVV